MAKKDFKKNTAELFISAAEEVTEAPAQKAAEEGLNIPKGFSLTREKKSDRLQLLIRPTSKEAVKKEAQAQGVSMNDLINQIIDEYIERKGLI